MVDKRVRSSELFFWSALEGHSATQITHKDRPTGTLAVMRPELFVDFGAI